MKPYLYKWLIALLATLFTFTSAQARQVDLKAELSTPVVEVGSSQKAFLKISLTGFELKSEEERTQANVAIVLDVSGSMAGDKIENAKEAAILAVDLLEDDDYVSIVTYDTSVDVIVPATKARNKSKIRRAIRKMKANGRTALFAGVSKGAAEVREYFDKELVNRVILLSDGQANVGPSSPTELGELGLSLGKEGISVTTIGLGRGYNEDLMVSLSGYSDGNHAFVEEEGDLAKIFQYEFGDVLSVVAKDVDIHIHLGEGVKPLRILGRDGEIRGNKVSTRLNQLYSDQEKYVLLEVEVPKGKASMKRDVAEVEVTYHNLLSKRKDQLNDAVQITYSESQEEIGRAVNKPVVSEATKQVANEASKEALKLRDQGRKKEAQRVLKQSAQNVRDQAASLGSSPAATELKAFSAEMEADADDILEEREWNTKRKSLKARQYKLDKQQKY